MDNGKEQKPEQKPTRQFLLDQINACQIAIFQNQGSINLCKAMLDKGIYIDEKEQENNEKVVS